jgi:hypothetical protein
VNAGNVHGFATRVGGHGASRFAIPREPPLDYSAALENPIVRRLDTDRRKVMIGHHVGG